MISTMWWFLVWPLWCVVSRILPVMYGLLSSRFFCLRSLESVSTQHIHSIGRNPSDMRLLVSGLNWDFPLGFFFCLLANGPAIWEVNEWMNGGSFFSFLFPSGFVHHQWFPDQFASSPLVGTPLFTCSLNRQTQQQSRPTSLDNNRHGSLTFIRTCHWDRETRRRLCVAVDHWESLGISTQFFHLYRTLICACVETRISPI